MTDQETSELPPWEQISELVPVFNEVMKLRKSEVVHRYLNPPPGHPRWVGGAHHPSKWRKDELAWRIAQNTVRAEYESGKRDA